jgi:iron complex transport system substrate-binding protein
VTSQVGPYTRSVRIVSLLPSATEIVFALGLGEELVGRTHGCDYPAEAQSVPVVTSTSLPSDLPSRRIDMHLRHALHAGAAPYELDVAALRAAEPDVVLTQDVCEACGLARRQVLEALRSAGSDAEVVSLEPTSIEGILHSITTVGAMTSAEDEAIGLVELLRERLGAIEAQVQRRRSSGVRPRRVVALEWLDPPFASGHWVPEQVRRAGGWDVLGREGQRALQTTWRAVMEVDPEQVLLMPCGFDAGRTADEWSRVERPAGWAELRAVRHGEVFALDAGAYFTRPGPRVIEGIAMLAELFDPQGFIDEAPSDAWIPVTGA